MPSALLDVIARPGPRWASAADPVPDVGRERRLDHLSTLELEIGARHPLEEALSRSEQNRRDGEHELLDDTRVEVLSEQLAAAHDDHILLSGGVAGTPECHLRAAGLEVEARVALDEPLRRTVRHHEDRNAEARLVSPAPGNLIHGPSDNQRSRGGKGATEIALIDLVRRSSGIAIAPGAAEHPVMQALAAAAQPLLRPVVGPGDVTVERHGEACDNLLRHPPTGSSSLPFLVALTHRTHSHRAMGVISRQSIWISSGAAAIAASRSRGTVGSGHDPAGRISS